MAEKETLQIGKGKPGPGRPKGLPNKSTTALKEAILAAAEAHGEDGEGWGGLTGYLIKVAREDVKAFAGLLGRVLPLDVNGSVGIHVTLEKDAGDL
jgi:hypothetical protein